MNLRGKNFSAVTPCHMVRLQKFLADAGIASRRACEEVILAGRVEVNGQRVNRLGIRVAPDLDQVALDGKPLQPRRLFYLALHKPLGFLCTRHDEFNRRRVIYDLLPPELKSLYSVGRLDLESEGLIFLTNDGAFCLRVTHPRYQIPKVYRVTTTQDIGSLSLQPLTKGIWHQGELLKASRIQWPSRGRHCRAVEITIQEGKNREIRRMFAAQGIKIRRLQRIKIGKVMLGDLRPGKFRLLQASEVSGFFSSDVQHPAVEKNRS